MKKAITMLLVGMTTLTMAQTTEETQYAAYLTAGKTMWERSISMAEKEAGANSFKKAIAMYGLLNNTMANQDEDTFDENVDQTIDLLKSISESNPDWGEPKAVLSSVYGLVMAYSPMKGMLYGSKSSSLIEEAMRLQPESPMVQKLYAGSKLYTPTMFGGSPEKAVVAFKEAEKLFELGDTKNDWMYLDTLVGLSLAYIKTEETELANATLNKAIEIEAEFHWAKSILASLNK
ncbi:MAG: hypothetical protein RIM99_04025 [Cyclobacteriaceae bacterium]